MLKKNRGLICGVMLMVAICLLVLLGQTAVADQSCSIIYQQADGWIIEMCPEDADVTVPMSVVLNGTVQGEAAFIRFAHPSEANPLQKPQVAVLYASGFVRLKPNADPEPPIPFGTSFVLGPAYWAGGEYFHNPQLSEMQIDTSGLPNGPVRLTAVGQNGDFDVQYTITLPTPRDRQTRLHVTQLYTATADILIDAVRLDEAQGFKWVQFSSMFINEGQSCANGHFDCHDSNAVRFVGEDMERWQRPFAPLIPSTFALTETTALGNAWVDLLHTDDDSWQGNTPNTRIALDELPATHTVTVQGWISATNSTDDDNVGVWLHDDGVASQSWTVGQSGHVGFWLMAQDNPTEPWDDLGLRSGEVMVDFEGEYDCAFVRDWAQTTSGSIYEIAGYTDTAVQLEYDLGTENGNWTQFRCDFDPPLDLSDQDHLRFDWRGDSDAANSLEVALISLVDGQPRIFGRGYHHPTHHYWWGQMVIPFDFLQPWTDDTVLNRSEITAVFFSVVKDEVADEGGSGTIAFDNVTAFNVVSRTVPTSFEQIQTHMTATETAVNWLVSQQQESGLLESWENETGCTSHIYDQALALIAFSHQGRWSEANAIIDGLMAAQNEDGSWYKAYSCDTEPPVDVSDGNKWEGDIAWAVIALGYYQRMGGTHDETEGLRQAAASWLQSRIESDNGCLVINHTEGTIDAWHAFHSMGAAYSESADGLESCLLTHYWDDDMGRFKGGLDWYQPYLDNQTWGAAFLKAICEPQQALRALSYAEAVLMLPAQGGQGSGLDGQGGPWSVWNEGTGQYIALGGEGSNELIQELLAQQALAGSLPNSFDDFSGGGVWASRWHGVAPTAWFIFALNGLPFEDGCNFMPFVSR